MHLTLFIDKYVAHTNHKHALVFLKFNVNEHVLLSLVSLVKKKSSLDQIDILAK